MYYVRIHDHVYHDDVILAGSFENLTDALDFVSAISIVMVACPISIQKGDNEK